MRLGWKVLIPVSLGWIMLVAAIRAFRNEGYDIQQIAIATAVVAAVVLVATVVWEMVRGGGTTSRSSPARSGARRSPPMPTGSPYPTGRPALSRSSGFPEGADLSEGGHQWDSANCPGMSPGSQLLPATGSGVSGA